MKGEVVEYQNPYGIIKVDGVNLAFKHPDYSGEVGDDVEVTLTIYPKRNKILGVGFGIGREPLEFHPLEQPFNIGCVTFVGENNDHGYLKELSQLEPFPRLGYHGYLFHINGNGSQLATNDIVLFKGVERNDLLKATKVESTFQSALFLGTTGQSSKFYITQLNKIVTLYSDTSNWQAPLYCELDIKVRVSDDRRQINLVNIGNAEVLYLNDSEKQLAILYHILTIDFYTDLYWSISHDLILNGAGSIIVQLMKQLSAQGFRPILEERKSLIIRSFILLSPRNTMDLIDLFGLTAQSLVDWFFLLELSDVEILEAASKYRSYDGQLQEMFLPRLREKFTNVQLYNAGFRGVLRDDDYVKLLSAHLDEILHGDNNILIFDIEVRRNQLQEFGYTMSGESACLYAVDYKTREHFRSAISAVVDSASLYVGHNILEFDIPYLSGHLGVTIDQSRVYDTMLWELFLSPDRDSYALAGTDHTAETDVKVTVDLLINQLSRICYTSEQSVIFAKEQLATFGFEGLNSVELSDEYQSEINTIIDTQASKFFKEDPIPDQGEILYTQIKGYTNGPTSVYLNTALWETLTKVRHLNVKFSGESDHLRVLDTTKIKANIAEGEFIRQVLLRMTTQRSPIYWASMPSIVKVILLRKLALSIDDVCSQVDFDSIESPITIYPFAAFDPVEINSHTTTVICTGQRIENICKVKLTDLSYDQIKEAWGNKSAWTHFTPGQSYVQIGNLGDQPIGQDLVGEYDRDREYQWYWIEKNQIGSYSLWATRDLQSLWSKHSKYLIILDIDSLLSTFKLKTKMVVVFNTSDDIDPEHRILALNPSTAHRALYWSVIMFKIRKLGKGKPTILFCSVPSEVEHLNTLFRSFGWYTPMTESTIRRRIELLVSSTSDFRIVVLSLEELDESIQWTQGHAITLCIESLPIDEQFILADRDVVHVIDYEDLTPNNSEEDVQLQGDVFKKLHSYSRTFRSIEQQIAYSNSKSELYLLDERFDDYPSIRNLYGLGQIKVDEVSDLEVFNQQLAVFKNYFSRNIDISDLDITQAITEIEGVFIKGNTLREDQSQFINRILPAQEDLVVTLPTGGGKSVLFEGPALYRGSLTGRLTLIISPLKALMQDHFDKLINLGFFTNVDYINQDKGLELQDIYRRLAGGELLFVYITPERFKSKGFVAALNQRLRADRQLEYVVYDEAHCISQWGNEFRPDYYRSVTYVKELRDFYGHFFPVLLFSATVTNQVYNDLSTHFPDLQRIEEYAHTNPIREHIDMQFTELPHLQHPVSSRVNAAFVEALIKDLKGKFNPKYSRVLVFVLSRRGTEDYSEAFNSEAGHPYVSSYYHAGMDSEARQSTYEEYKMEYGGCSVLFATKAFGMGMDIPNIHYVYHFGPSTNFEDFLQEIGRAGRDEQSREAAGFYDDQKIRTKCYLTDQSFSFLRELIHNSQISWEQIGKVDLVISQFMDKNGRVDPDREDPIPVPLDLLRGSEYFTDVNNLQEVYTIAMYWLEKIGRYRQRYFVPGVMTFSNLYKRQDEVSGEQQKAISQLLEEYDDGTAQILVPTTKLYPLVRPKSLNRVFQLMLQMHHNGELEIAQTIAFDSFKTQFVRERPVYHQSKSTQYLYLLSGAKRLVLALTHNIKYQSRDHYSKFAIGQEVSDVFNIVFNTNVFEEIWSDANPKKQAKKKISYFNKAKKDFAKRMQAAFYMLNNIRGLKVEYKLSVGDNQVYTIIYKNTANDAIESQLSQIVADCQRMIYVVSEYILTNQGEIDLVTFLNQLAFSNQSLYYANFIIVLCKKLGYFKPMKSIIPFSIETYLLSDALFEDQHNFQQEFVETVRLKKLRLMVLESIQRIHISRHGEYITGYFKCSSEADIVNLISEFDPGANLSQFREIALNEAYADLNADQRAIFDFDISKNLNVIAGPGTGKTHTLVLRVAMLIQKKFISPDKILLLAYNRSVVEELRSRVREIFNKLGYKSITRDLKIHTFASLVKYTLRNRLDIAEQVTPRYTYVNGRQELDVFKTREAYFLHLLQHEPGTIRMELRQPHYIFVDEFQDITNDRIDILKGIYTDGVSSITVIGDPIQSIYGFEREGNIDPSPYYDHFKAVFNPEVLPLSINYRSTTEIVQYGQSLLAHQNSIFGLPPLTSFYGSETGSCEVIDLTLDLVHTDWSTRVTQFIDDQSRKEMALLFRTNGELFRAYTKLREMGVPSQVMHLQSSNDNFVKTREVGHFMERLQTRTSVNFSKSIKEKLTEIIQSKITDQPNWERHLLEKLIALTSEFYEICKPSDTISEFLDYVVDISRKDDGVLWKLYTKHYSDTDRQRIVLSTMHKSKGLEFDEVIVMPSFSNLDANNDEFDSLCEEEERLLYVAITRAKHQLYHYRWRREAAVFTRVAYTGRDVGLYLKPGIHNLFINSFGSETIQMYLHDSLEVGDKVSFVATQNNHRRMVINNHQVGVVSGSVRSRINRFANSRVLKDYYITRTFKYYCEEMVEADANNGTEFYQSLTQYSKDQGYVLLPIFAGYGNV